MNHHNSYIKKRAGFTLIELLVVIAIISIMSAIILGSLSQARVRAKDAVRKRNFQELRNALALYYTKWNVYPVTPVADGWHSSVDYERRLAAGSCGMCDYALTDNLWIPEIVAQGFIPELPKEPSEDPFACGTDVDGRSYRYISDGVNYKIQIHCPDSIYILNTPSTDPFWDPDTTGHAPTWMICEGPGCRTNPPVYSTTP
jgi:prepilin-type N-terminal cleavage/methylation domain-containing protein